MSMLTIGSGAIELAGGGGGGVPMQEVARVARLFEELFGVAPRIRVSGRFERDAMGPVPGGDENVDVWDLRKSMGSYCDVLHVGGDYLSVQLFTGLNNGRAAALAPARGVYVKLRFMLPGEPLQDVQQTEPKPAKKSSAKGGAKSTEAAIDPPRGGVSTGRRRSRPKG